MDKLGRKFYYGGFSLPSFQNFLITSQTPCAFSRKLKRKLWRKEWDDRPEPVYQATLKADNLPDTIVETADDILDEVIECKSCGRGYKIVQGELGLLRKLTLPLPRECPKCREGRRFDRLNPVKLYDRECKKCGGRIKTAFAPDRPGIVYCGKCYQQEFL